MFGACESYEKRQATHEVILGTTVFAVCDECSPAVAAVPS